MCHWQNAIYTLGFKKTGPIHMDDSSRLSLSKIEVNRYIFSYPQKRILGFLDFFKFKTTSYLYAGDQNILNNY